MSLRSLSTSIFSTALLLTMVLSLTPVGMAGDGDAGQAGEFLRYGVSVRSLGMGRAYVGAANDATGMYYNAAGLVRLPNKYSAYFMNFRPLMESNYYFFSAALARPDSMAVGWKGFFFGPEAAWGVAAVHMNTGEFEYRTADDDLIDADFSMYQQAAMLAFAREFSGSGGILGLGFNLKIVRQGVSEIDAPLENSDVGFGLDFGTQLQMINPPVIKGLTSAPLIGPFFKLRHLLPLHLGLNIQNVISPQVGFGETAEKHPTTMRFGGTYFFDNLGVINGLNLFEGSRLTLVSDLEWMFADMGKLISWNTSGQRGARWYGGIELEGQINDISLMFPRLGYNTADGPGRWGVGAGLKWVMQDWTFQFDAAYGTHAELDNDWRVSLTLSRGGKRDASYFVRESQPATSLSRRSTMLHVVSGYPAHWQDIEVAATELQSSLDTVNRERYLDLVGGPNRARYLARQAIEAFQRGDRGEARTMALLAIEEYQGVVSDAPHIMHDNDYLLYGQCEMISAATDGGRARDAWRRATTVFEGIQIATLQKHFLTGTCWHMLSEFDNAATSFSAALETGTDEAQSMRKLSRLWLGDALMNGGRPDSAIVVLTSITDDHTLQEGEVDADYPRYWTFSDMQITDDAQYLKAQCYLKKNDEMAATAEFLKICRFYSGSDKCSGANNEADKLIQRLLEKTR